MATASPLRSFDPQPIAQPPDCAACGERMQLAGIAPHSRFTRLDVHRYGCECGRTSEEAVLREA
jgi:hypothetical protein